VNMIRNFQFAVFFVVMPCGDVVGYHLFGQPCEVTLALRTVGMGARLESSPP
jgi:hypothetical protein